MCPRSFVRRGACSVVCVGCVVWCCFPRWGGMKGERGWWIRWLPASHLTALLVATAVGTTVLAVAPHELSLTYRLSFISPASSCVTATTTRHTRPATAGLTSVAGRPSTSAAGLRSAPCGQGITRTSGQWFNRRGGPLRLEASAEGAPGGGDGGDDAEGQERKRTLGELDRR